MTNIAAEKCQIPGACLTLLIENHSDRLFQRVTQTPKLEKLFAINTYMIY